LVLRDAFHGRTYGALSATPQEAKQAPFAPLVPGFLPVAKEVAALEAAVGEQTAAILLEPIQGEGGVLPLPEDLLQAARALCDRYGAALIFDEVQTGMGRTGTLWAYEQTSVVPDALTTAKALGGGLPIGALVTGPRLADIFQPGDHASTFAGGPLVCSAALVALEICSEPALLASVVNLGERFAAALEELPFVRSVRGRGLLIGAELAPEVSAVELVGRALTEERLVINATGPSSLRMEPPLIVTEAEIDDAVARLGRLVK
jgi:acetylornithine/N-succinyldiaminopimelate aminotransferase